MLSAGMCKPLEKSRIGRKVRARQAIEFEDKIISQAFERMTTEGDYLRDVISRKALCA
jgi:hypothetical protein